MGIINILALNEKEIETIKLLLEYVEKKGKNEDMKVICSQLLEKIRLKYYFSPEEDGKLHGLSQKAKALYYEFYEKYDFDLIDFVGRISEEYKATAREHSMSPLTISGSTKPWLTNGPPLPRPVKQRCDPLK